MLIVFLFLQLFWGITDKTVIYLKRIMWLFDIRIYCERILTIKFINIPITCHIFTFCEDTNSTLSEIFSYRIQHHQLVPMLHISSSDLIPSFYPSCYNWNFVSIYQRVPISPHVQLQATMSALCFYDSNFFFRFHT